MIDVFYRYERNWYNRNLWPRQLGSPFHRAVPRGGMAEANDRTYDFHGHRVRRSVLKHALDLAQVDWNYDHIDPHVRLDTLTQDQIQAVIYHIVREKVMA